MKTSWKDIVVIACAVLMVGACNPLDVDTPRNINIDPPDPDLRPARTISLAIIIDGSTSMGPDNDRDQAVASAKEMVEMLNDTYDQSSVIWFNNIVQIEQEMTYERFDVIQALDKIPSTGNSRLWDGAYEGVLEVVNRGNEDVKAAILITDGAEEIRYSNHTLDDVIDLAHSNRIFVSCVGLRSKVDSVSLKQLAAGTDGQYYANQSNDTLTVILRDIISTLRETP
jgi:Mg-chelatase subunit ChlD